MSNNENIEIDESDALAEALADSMIPTNPKALEPFVISIENEWITSNGIGWVASVISPSGASFNVENDGNGGCNRYLTFDDASKALYSIFQKASREAYPKASEPEDLACLWLEIREIPEYNR